MQKLLTLIVAAAILYQVIDYKIAEVSSNKKIVVEEKTPDTAKDSGDPKLEGGFLEKSLSTVLINVLKTPEGRTFFENIL